ncbi:hypothetical protein [Mycolicibacter algericus]|uniref:Uncharacterized protein n=2 Tax=Mycolicibacter algericus TaxID=1288388 RepID=A0A7I9YE51_MYCAL|nr:hypothetical protein [Mycolicibacter algericus]GFG86916.1 hypothetical protein MALGJ_35920 [Mycolicibacter algericus]
MKTPSTARQRLGEELAAMRQAKGKPTLKSLVAQASKKYKVELSDSALSEWFRGRAVPHDYRHFAVLVQLLTNLPPNEQLKRLHRDAWQETRKRQHSQNAHPVETTPQSRSGPWLPRLVEVHYANLERIAELMLSRTATGDLPVLPASSTYGAIGAVEKRQALLRGFSALNLPCKRFTRDFSLRSLDTGDLFVFDTWFRTRNGPAPQNPVPLTGDLNKDPHVYIQRQRVRIIMPLNPRWVTTGTAYGEFGSGGVQLAGVCIIKGRVHPEDAKLVPPTNKVLYRASPLVLGIADPFDRDTDLRHSVVFDVIDVDSDSLITVGPWGG